MGPLSRRLGTALVATVALGLAPSRAAGPGVAATRHNLSVSGPGEVRSRSETEVCVFCHGGHVQEAAGPLWNRSTAGAPAYRPYESGTMASLAGQPDGATRMCLSCHDGTVAVGLRPERSGLLGDDLGTLRKDQGGLGTDLSGSHPVSVPYRDAAGRMALGSAQTRLRTAPAEVGARSLLDAAGKVQCTTCHDPHSDPSALGRDVPPFWKGDSYDEVCEACHQAPVVEEGHRDPGRMPAGCGSCHVGHGVERQPLLPKAEEESCLQCHGDRSALEAVRDQGRVTRQAQPAAIGAELDKPYRHPVRESRGLHDADEDLRQSRRSQRHVECVDCHPVHGEPGFERAATLRQRGAWRDDQVGGRTEHELCYDCHGSSGDLPYGQTDKSVELSPRNESYHPVEAPLGKRSVPSLLAPWVEGDVMTCGDCHGSDEADAPDGPHGSRNRWILRQPYEASDFQAESASVYQACYACHSRSSILADESFAGHYQHVVQAQASCYACHDSHGSPEYPGLVRFGKDFRYGKVLPSSSGRLEYDPAGGGSCALTCHEVDHDPLGYP